MTKKRILAIGLELASDKVEHSGFREKRSLLDWDIIIFKPVIHKLCVYDETHQGKPCLTENASFRLTDICKYWNQQIKLALDAGKTIIAFATDFTEVVVDTGERNRSGTGRNEKTTIIVENYDNYRSLPINLDPVETYGTKMRLSINGSSWLAPYWKEFGSHSSYKVFFEEPTVPSCIVTSDGNKAVGAIYNCANSSGTLLVLPDIDFESDSFFEEEGEQIQYTNEAKQFAAQFLHCITELDQQLQRRSDTTPTPSWALEEKYVLEPELQLKTALAEAKQKEEAARSYREELEEKCREICAYKALLYEKGKPLENAVADALELMGFHTSSFEESSSQFDVVFVSEQGRLVGEAEGKDNKAINIEKFRQLNLNIQEDFERSEVEAPAKPVLFGNPYRLKAPENRDEPFTEKCTSAASVNSTALVFTPELFHVVKFLLHYDDPDYSRECRRIILETIGRVTFPKPLQTKCVESK
ncbi:MAG: hypothetical protein OXO49_05660 [Gammaproteobacteria bacterium]|nr:hypothetical protein [Gammaproteobacteria bacterium]MDE0252600.1 hypothetical protein [Gammaproteobacteria bacterium]MDE0403486.1 hypothetical protein [Gammaproteobacteria bacterium]